MYFIDNYYYFTYLFCIYFKKLYVFLIKNEKYYFFGKN